MAVPTLELPARAIPVPVSISPQAQAALTPVPVGARPAFPPVHDTDAWREVIPIMDAGMIASLEPRARVVRATVETTTVAGVAVHVVEPSDVDPGLRHRVVLEIHGGGFVCFGGEACKVLGQLAAGRFRATTWAVDYRMPPDHLYPASLDDCVAVYRALLDRHRPEDVIVSGTSAGGNLAAALILRARDEGLPLPAGAVLLTPAIDLTESGDTFQTLRGIDNVLTGNIENLTAIYAGNHDRMDPYLSPLFGDFSKGFPPTFLQSGTRDLLLSNTVRMHRALRRAGVAAELHVFEAMPHGGFFGAPEDDELDIEVRRFVAARFAPG